MSTDHLYRLPGTQWALWRWVCVRGAGFPAARALALAMPDAARRADALLDAQDEASRSCAALVEALRAASRDVPPERRAAIRKARKRAEKGHRPDPNDLPDEAKRAADAFDRAKARLDLARAEADAAYAAARASTSRELRSVAADPAFREAVTWQNPGAVVTALDELLTEHDTLRSHSRQHEELIASYLHRYATKNDTIGFFGPVGWARVDAAAPTDVVARSDSLLAARGVYFEQWPIDTISRKLSEDGRFDRWSKHLGHVRSPGFNLNLF